jgi:hypothetical protein
VISTMVSSRPDDPLRRDMFHLEVHDAVFDALVEEGAIVDGFLDPQQLESWADSCENPEGQRAAMARAIAQLRRVAPLSVGRRAG